MFKYQFLFGYIFIFCAVCPAMQSWPLGKVIVLLCCLIWITQRYDHHIISILLYRIALFILFSFSMWIVLFNIFDDNSKWIFFLLWVIISIYIINSIKYCRGLWFYIIDNLLLWPKKSIMITLLYIILGGFILTHYTLNTLLNKPFQVQWWNSSLLAFIAFILFYPSILDAKITKYERRMVHCILPFIIAILTISHSYNYLNLSLQLKNDVDLNHIINSSFNKGYKDIGIKSVVKVTKNRLKNNQWQSAISFMRRYWQYAPKEEFAEEWWVGDEDKYLLFFTLCFGCNLKTQYNESTVDMLINIKNEKLYVATSKGRIIEISNEEVKLHVINNSVLKKLAINDDNIYILDNGNHIYKLNNNQSKQIYQLPHKRKWNNIRWDDLIWKDIEISKNGTKIWVMDDHGTIEEIVYKEENDKWEIKEEVIYPPLWSQSDQAVEFYHYNDNNFVVLDRYGGVHWRGSIKSRPENFYDKNIKKYYHPEKPNKVDIDYWDHKNNIIILNKNGRIDFITKKYVDNNDQSSVFYDWKIDPIHSIRATMEFNREYGKRYYPDRAMAVTSIRNIDTIAVLFKSGMIQLIAMPAGIRIEIEKKYSTINTRK